ncbi:hypothetical protein WBJ53_05465 [Spirosoma sp. SC4-14]|uniref:hypothetical protein n=1 Tax=Spirosoma sp. SC4-14 TaxID=3128900 RepID=UPI0030D38463
MGWYRVYRIIALELARYGEHENVFWGLCQKFLRDLEVPLHAGKMAALPGQMVRHAIPTATSAFAAPETEKSANGQKSVAALHPNQQIPNQRFSLLEKPLPRKKKKQFTQKPRGFLIFVGRCCKTWFVATKTP